jgi:hypothetical protein
MLDAALRTGLGTPRGGLGAVYLGSIRFISLSQGGTMKTCKLASITFVLVGAVLAHHAALAAGANSARCTPGQSGLFVSSAFDVDVTLPEGGWAPFEIASGKYSGGACCAYISNRFGCQVKDFSFALAAAPILADGPHVGRIGWSAMNGDAEAGIPPVFTDPFLGEIACIGSNTATSCGIPVDFDGCPMPDFWVSFCR